MLAGGGAETLEQNKCYEQQIIVATGRQHQPTSLWFPA